MIARTLAIIGATAIALTAGHFGLLAVAPLAALLWFWAMESVSRGRSPSRRRQRHGNH